MKLIICLICLLFVFAHQEVKANHCGIRLINILPRNYEQRRIHILNSKLFPKNRDFHIFPIFSVFK